MNENLPFFILLIFSIIDVFTSHPKPPFIYQDLKKKKKTLEVMW